MISTLLSAIPESEVDAEGITWLTNLEEAEQLAAEKDVPVFIHFTGSDWCGWCIKLKDEVYSKQIFQDYAADNLIMVKIDFPKYTTLPEDTKNYNNALAQKYGVKGFPTVVITDVEGKELARTGYQYGGAAKYIDHIKELLGQE